MKAFGPLSINFSSFLGCCLLLMGIALCLSGCYTLKQGFTLIGYLSRGKPLDSIRNASDEEGDTEKNRQFVDHVMAIRRFAQEELGLRETKNYTRYVDINRNYLAAVVSGTAKDSFAPYQWRYPIIGRAPYKGFFSIEDARREAIKLEKRDLDVWIRGVDAFSTLGWFRDPLYSYMREYPIHQLADLLIHELFHATVYITGQSQFNEELAEFIGREGARQFILATFGPNSAELDAMHQEQADSRTYIAFLRELIADLEAVYSQEIPREEKLSRKEQLIQEAQKLFEAEYDSRFLSDAYRGFAELQVNNAYLSLFRLYYGERDYYQELYTASGLDLPGFIAAAKTIRSRGDPKSQLIQALGL